MEDRLNPQESLDYIRNVILDSKAIIKDKGDVAIFWGILIIIAQMSTYFMIKAQVYLSIGVMWAAVIAFGWIVTVIVSSRKNRKGVSTNLLKIDSATWFSAGISMSIIGFSGVYSGMINPFGINAVIALFLGNAFFITGMVYNLNMFKYSAVGWWAGGTVLFWFKNENTFIIFSVLMLLFQTVPGIIQYMKFKKEEVKQ